MGEQGSGVVTTAAYGEDDFRTVGVDCLGESFADAVEVFPRNRVNPLSIGVVIR